MNEGCNGGLFYFGGLFGERAGLVSEECAPYLAKTQSTTCASYKDCPIVAKIQKSYFLAEYSGKPTVNQIKKELIRNGPVNTEIFAPDGFSHHKKGIFYQADKNFTRDLWGGSGRQRQVQAQTEEVIVPAAGDISYLQVGKEDP